MFWAETDDSTDNLFVKTKNWLVLFRMRVWSGGLLCCCLGSCIYLALCLVLYLHLSFAYLCLALVLALVSALEHRVFFFPFLLLTTVFVDEGGGITSLVVLSY